MTDVKSPAEMLRQAAELMRKQGGPKRAFWLALAEYLGDEAEAAEGLAAGGSTYTGSYTTDHVLGIARAYLAETP